MIDRSGGGRFNGEAKVAQTRENRIPASERRRLKLLRFRVEIQRVAKSCLQTGALAREHDKLRRQRHERRTGNKSEREQPERERERERESSNELLSLQDQLKYPWWLLESRAENTKRGNKNKINGAYPYSGGCKLYEDPGMPVRSGENVATPAFYFLACTSHYARDSQLNYYAVVATNSHAARSPSSSFSSPLHRSGFSSFRPFLADRQPNCLLPRPEEKSALKQRASDMSREFETTKLLLFCMLVALR